MGRVSSGPLAGAADVLLVDTVGELASLYSLATSAFVGGSLVRVGGHNLLEPLAAGAPGLLQVVVCILLEKMRQDRFRENKIGLAVRGLDDVGVSRMSFSLLLT